MQKVKLEEEARNYANTIEELRENVRKLEKQPKVGGLSNYNKEIEKLALENGRLEEEVRELNRGMAKYREELLLAG